MDCPRCGKPVKGTGKTGLCRSCAVTLATRKRDNPWKHHAMSHRTRRNVPVTLARTP
jgi:tRNA(Ile2) C34 agmatinyltransferase TiaS